jgi:hypothetical protein
MREADRLQAPGTASTEKKSVEAGDPGYVPHAAADHSPEARYARVGAERRAAAAQISRTVRVWRKAAEGGHEAAEEAPEITAAPSGIMRMPAKGNVKDSGVIDSAQALINDKKADDMADALDQLMAQAKGANDTAMVKKIESTKKALGLKGSRHKKGGKRR